MPLASRSDSRATMRCGNTSPRPTRTAVATARSFHWARPSADDLYPLSAAAPMRAPGSGGR